MKFTFIIIAILQLSILGCKNSAPISQVPSESIPVSTPIASEPPKATEVGTVNTITFVCKACNDKEKAMLPKMQAKLNDIIKSQCFADHIIEKKFSSRLEQTNGMTREQVVNHIKTTSVKDIPLVFYYPSWRQSKNVVGYTYPDAPEIYLNRLFRDSDSWGLCAEISNAIHEVTHKQGFDHDYKATERRPFSVPYRSNYASDSCCIE